VVAVAVIFAAPGLRHFYDLELPPGDVVAEAAAVAVGAVAALEIAWRARLLGRAAEPEVAGDGPSAPDGRR